jgi:hypothetical protein
MNLQQMRQGSVATDVDSVRFFQCRRADGQRRSCWRLCIFRRESRKHLFAALLAPEMGAANTRLARQESLQVDLDGGDMSRLRQRSFGCPDCGSDDDVLRYTFADESWYVCRKCEVRWLHSRYKEHDPKSMPPIRSDALKRFVLSLPIR